MKQRDKMVDVFCRISDPERMDRFLGEILTQTERHDLALRWRLMEMLESGMSQRDVAAELGVSLCKITRGSRVLKKKGSVSRALIQTEEKDAPRARHGAPSSITKQEG